MSGYLRDTSVKPHSYQSDALDSVRLGWRESQSQLIILPTGCVSAETVVGINRAGKGYSRRIGEAFRLQFDPRIDPEIVPKVRSFVGDRIGLNSIRGFVSSGDKGTCELSLVDGKTLRATPDHEVYSEDGWIPLGDLRVGQSVVCEASPKSGGNRRAKPQYQMVQGLLYHPYCQAVCSRSRAGRKAEGPLRRVARHRLIVEARLNGLDFEDFITICRSKPARAQTLRFLDPAVYAVHHIDRDPRNNVPSNLVAMTHEDHAAEHGRTDKLPNLGFGATEMVRVRDVHSHGVEPTYDVVCHDPHRNFVANGIVVHNCGKTIVTAFVVRDHLNTDGRPALFLAHTEELVAQAIGKFEVCGVPSVPEKAEHKARELIRAARNDMHDPRDIRVVVACVASLKGKRLESWPRDYFGLVIRDEAHHSRADTDLAILEHFNEARVLGVTATPKRGDGRCISRIYRRIAYQLTLAEAISRGLLCPIRLAQSEEKIDLSGLKIKAGDYSPGDLEHVIGPKVAKLASAAAEKLKGTGRPFLTFTPDVRTARAFADAFTGIGLECRSVAGGDYDRADTIEHFRAGGFPGLSNCMVLTEGFDHPPIAAIVLARPTKSLTLMAQAIGRGTRLSPGKEDVMVIDFDWQTDRVRGEVVRPFDLIAEGLDDATRAHARKMSGDGLEIAELIRKAKAAARKDADEEASRKAAERLERERLKVAAHSGRSGVNWRDRDFLAGPGGDSFALESPSSGMASQAQITRLAQFGVGPKVAKGLTSKAAGERLRMLVDRDRRGLATYKQVNLLAARGIKREAAELLTKRQASEAIEIILGSRRREAYA